MRVLHIINTLSAGGAELHLLTLCRHLKIYGIKVFVVCLKEHVSGSRTLRQDFEKEGIFVVNLEAERFYKLSLITRIRRLIAEIQPDIVHTHLPRADFVGFLICMAFPSIYWVSSIHDIYSKTWSGRKSLPLFSQIWKKADVLIAISFAVQEWLITKRKLAKEKIKVIYYGIATDKFRKPNINLRKVWALDGNPVIGSIGRLEPRKGHETLIRAMPAILEKEPAARLLIAGHDPWNYKRRLKALIREMRLSESVQLVGFQSDIPSFLHALDIFAFASQSEGFGQVLIEAMAAKKPVVASRIFPVTEIVVQNDTGFLVEVDNYEAFADAIIKIVGNPVMAKKLGKNGANRVKEKFSAIRMTEKTITLYQKILTEKIL
jgi:glycosyltransferase involved in cell wall biosynthesis